MKKKSFDKVTKRKQKGILQTVKNENLQESLICGIQFCKAKLDSKESYLQHYNLHHGFSIQATNTCNDCGYRDENRLNYLRHACCVLHVIRIVYKSA